MAGKPQQDQETTPAPEPVFVPMMAGWPVIVVCGIFTVAGIFQAANRYSGPFSPWWLALLGLIATVVTAWESRHTYPPSLYGNLQCDLAAVVSTLCGLSATAWLVWTGYVGIVDTWAPLLLLGVAGTALWWGVLWNGNRIDANQAPEVAPAGQVQAAVEWPAVLKRVDKGAHQVTEIEEHRAGVALICHPVEIDGAKLPTYQNFMGLAPDFATAAALAVRKAGGRLPVNAVRTAPGRDDAEYRLEITTRDVFAGMAVPYQPDLEPRDIAQGIDLGEDETGDRVLIKILYRHTQITGATDAGKSVLANNLIGRMTGCGNALVWVGATDKLIPLVWPWLRCYFEGRVGLPVLDRVAGMHIRFVLRMLADAYQLACERNAELADESKMKPTRDYPAVFVILEETSHGMEFQDKIVTHDGLTCTMSKLVKLIVRNGRSAGVHLVLMSQVALNEAFGAEAPTIKRQLSVKFCLRTNEDYDGYRTLSGLSGSVRTTQLANNTMLFQQVRENADVARAIPAKAAYLDGTETIGHIAERHAGWRPQLERPLNDYYAHRWDEDAHPELARVVQAKGLAWRMPTGGGTYRRPDPVPPAAPVPPAQPPTTEQTPDPTPVAPHSDPLVDDEQAVDTPGATATSEGPDDLDKAWESIMLGWNLPTAPDPLPPASTPQPGDFIEGPPPGSVLGLPRPEDSKLFRTLDDIIERPVLEAPDSRDARLPAPIGDVRRYLKSVPAARFVTTEEIAAAVPGYDDGTVGARMRLGQAIFHHLKIQSRNPRTDERTDTRQKGYGHRELWEAIEKLRFGMP